MPKYRVTLQCQAWMEAMVTVEADSEDEAEEKAMALPDDEKYWELEQVDKDTEEVCGIYEKEDMKKKETIKENAEKDEG